MNEKKTPAIRFQEFTDDWKQRKLGDKMYIKSRIGWQRLTKDEYLSSGEYYLITGTDIDEYTHTIDLKHSYYVSKDRYDKDSNIQVHNGDIIVTKDGTIGKVAMVCNLDKPATLNSHLFVLRDMSGKIYNRFLLQFLTSDLFTRFVDATKTGSTLTGMPQKIFVKFQYMIPSFSEQKKVADMLDGIANIIAIHQRKLTKLQLLKKSMLTKMFPKDGARVPEIRFQGFHGEWKQCKLGNLADSFEYGLNAAAKKFDGQNKYIRITDIDDSTHEFMQSELTSPDTVLKQANNYKLHEGDILFARTGASVGKTYIYKKSDGHVYYAGFLIRAKISEKYFSEFVFQNTLTSNYDKYVRITSQRSGQPGVNAQEYAEFKLLVPKIEEQHKVGKFLRSIDSLITLQQRKLSKLQQIKQAMLSKLFV